jgi:hypothetical protein
MADDDQEIPDPVQQALANGPAGQAPDVSQGSSAQPSLAQQPVQGGSRLPGIAGYIADLLNPPTRVEAQLGQMAAARPISRSQVSENFFSNFVQALGQGFASEGHGPGSFARGFGAAMNAPMVNAQQQANRDGIGEHTQSDYATIGPGTQARQLPRKHRPGRIRYPAHAWDSNAERHTRKVRRADGSVHNSGTVSSGRQSVKIIPINDPGQAKLLDYLVLEVSDAIGKMGFPLTVIASDCGGCQLEMTVAEQGANPEIAGFTFPQRTIILPINLDAYAEGKSVHLKIVHDEESYKVVPREGELVQ